MGRRAGRAGAQGVGGSIAMAQSEHKSFATPDETRRFERGRVEIVHVAGSDVAA